MTKNRYRTLRACPQALIVSTLRKHRTYSGYDLSYVSPNIVVDRAKKNVCTLFPPKNREKIHYFRYFIICGFTPTVSMFIGQGLSLEARRAAQAERWSANTATAPASVAAATAAASTTAAAAANEWASPAAAASTTAAAKSGLRQFKALKSIRPVRTGPIKFILFVNIPGLFLVYSGINREN